MFNLAIFRPFLDRLKRSKFGFFMRKIQNHTFSFAEFELFSDHFNGTNLYLLCGSSKSSSSTLQNMYLFMFVLNVQILNEFSVNSAKF